MEHAPFNFLLGWPVELFIVVGAFLEELISPIPSVAILVPGGATAMAQGLPPWYIVVLAVLAAAARVPAAMILYVLAAKLRDRLFARRKQWFRVSRADIQRVHKKLNSGNQSWWILMAAWAMPLVPGAPISLACGFIRLKLDIFATATFVGSVFNALFYLYVGYFGIRALELLAALELWGQITAAIIVAALIAWLWRRHTKKRQPAGH